MIYRQILVLSVVPHILAFSLGAWLTGCTAAPRSTNGPDIQSKPRESREVKSPSFIPTPKKWKLQQSGAKVNLTRVHFVDAEYGWVVGEAGTIIHTTDGGMTWVEQTSNTDIGLLDVCFLDRNTGWITGGGFTDRRPYSILLYTKDGGITWEKKEATQSEALWRLRFVDAENGWRIGQDENDDGLIAHTTDGGISWNYSRIPKDSIDKRGSVINEADFVNAQEGWAVGDFVIHHTLDGGATWETQYVMNVDPLKFYRIGSVQFLNNQIGCVSGSNDGDTGYLTGIVRTTDGGKSWTESHTQLPLTKLHFFDSEVGIGIGRAVPPNYPGDLGYGRRRDGVIMLTTDSGKTWREVYRVSDKPFSDVFFTKDGYGWAVGDKGIILRYKP